MIIAELEYYGIAVGETTIIDTAVNNRNYAKSMAEMMRTLEGDVSSTGEKQNSCIIISIIQYNLQSTISQYSGLD